MTTGGSRFTQGIGRPCFIGLSRQIPKPLRNIVRSAAARFSGRSGQSIITGLLNPTLLPIWTSHLSDKCIHGVGRLFSPCAEPELMYNAGGKDGPTVA